MFNQPFPGVFVGSVPIPIPVPERLCPRMDIHPEERGQARPQEGPCPCSALLSQAGGSLDSALRSLSPLQEVAEESPGVESGVGGGLASWATRHSCQIAESACFFLLLMATGASVLSRVPVSLAVLHKALGLEF